MNENTRLDIFDDQIRAWWTSVLAGQIDQPYPDRRLKINATLDGDTLVLSGRVPSEADLRTVLSHVEPFVGREIAEILNEIAVVPEEQEDTGILVQTLIGTFESEAQARFAADLLQNKSGLSPKFLTVLRPGMDGNSERETRDARGVLTDTYWEDVTEILAKDEAVLVVTVDETAAFQVREILDEDTRSRRTVVLPPDPAQTLSRVLDQNETATSPRRRRTSKVAKIPGSDRR